MSEVHFRFSPNILVRLGEELNQGTDQSILELIKNSYDADAKKCVVELIDTTQPGGKIIVTDDGEGMDGTSIRDSWLVLGKSSKNSSQSTLLGRVPSGSKGLGRLAALRMGRVVKLQSTKFSADFSSQLIVSWDLFDNASTVEEVDLIIDSVPAVMLKGTRTELQDLRTAIRSDELKKLARVVLLLTDPFEDKESGFEVVLKAAEFDEIEKLLKQKYFDSCEYHLSTRVDDNGMVSAQIKDWQGNVLHEGTHEQVRRKSAEPYKIPPSKFDFWAFLLKKDSFTSGRNVNLGDVREWLKHFGGVHVYQDDVRVSPYGGTGDDWLGINLTRTQNPEERPSTNNSIGRVSLSNRGKYFLTQKTDRSGYIEDEVFLELKSFTIDSLDWMAKWRLNQADKRRTAEKRTLPAAAVKEKSNFEDVLQQAPPVVRAKLSQAFDKYAKSRDREAESLRKEIQLYRTLSTAGITAATFAHESHGNPLKVIELGINTISARSSQFGVEAQAPVQKVISKIRAALDALATLSSATLSLIKANKRRVGKVEINKVVIQITELLKPFYEARETEVNLELTSKNPFLRCSEAAIESVLSNLINNALNAFRRDNTKKRLIDIKTEIIGESCIIVVADSGPGISASVIGDIWTPGFTSDPDGTGLGLTIVRDTVKDLGGDAEVISPGFLGGAEFRVRLPIIGK
ncbi:sensor histidine kinase [Pseudomonas syringae]|uniref:sensor histidine kinase n=1 Tax=Pseudomonas syringae TaxID=317 RepID=UPI003204E8F6